MSQLTKAFSVNWTGFSPAEGEVVGVVLKPEPEHVAERQLIGEPGDSSTLLRSVAQRVQGERP